MKSLLLSIVFFLFNDVWAIDLDKSITPVVKNSAASLQDYQKYVLEERRQFWRDFWIVDQQNRPARQDQVDECLLHLETDGQSQSCRLSVQSLTSGFLNPEKKLTLIALLERILIQQKSLDWQDLQIYQGLLQSLKTMKNSLETSTISIPSSDWRYFRNGIEVSEREIEKSEGIHYWLALSHDWQPYTQISTGPSFSKSLQLNKKPWSDQHCEIQTQLISADLITNQYEVFFSPDCIAKSTQPVVNTLSKTNTKSQRNWWVWGGAAAATSALLLFLLNGKELVVTGPQF